MKTRKNSNIWWKQEKIQTYDDTFLITHIKKIFKKWISLMNGSYVIAVWLPLNNLGGQFIYL